MATHARRPGYSAVPTRETGSGSPVEESLSRRSRMGAHPRQIIGTLLNLLNTILGAGLLAMPAALSHMGLAFGIFVITWSGIASGLGLYFQVRCAEYVKKASFFSISRKTYPQASVAFEAAIAVKCFGVGVSYLIIIGDLMPGVVLSVLGPSVDGTYLADRQFWITAFMLLLIPFVFLKKLDSLKYISFVALIPIAYLTVLVVYHYFKGDTIEERGEVLIFRWESAIATLASFPAMVFAYTCHQNMFDLLNEGSQNTRKNNVSIILISIGTACALYILVSSTGYLSFGNNIRPNIISMYESSLASTVGRASIVVLVLFSFPLQLYPCRGSLRSVLDHFFPPEPSSEPPEPVDELAEEAASPKDDKNSPERDARFAFLTTLITILSYIVAMNVTSLERVLAYVGSTGSTSISFILPGFFYYKISNPESELHKKLVRDNECEESLIEGTPSYRKERFLRVLSLCLAIYGVVVMVLCLGTNFFLR